MVHELHADDRHHMDGICQPVQALSAGGHERYDDGTGVGCFYLSIEMCKTRLEMSIAGITAIFLATKGATWGLCVGLGLCLIMGAFKNAKYEEETMGTESPEDVLTEEVVPDVLATIAEEDL